MTREERNTKLKHFITCMKCEMDGKECDANCHIQYEAGNMGEIIENLEAISNALEQEPCETQMIDKSNFSQEQYKADLQCAYDCGKASVKPCKDAINRQAVLKTLDDMDNVLDEDRTIENYKELLKECYEVLPPVNPQPKTGQWIDADGDNAICGCCNRLNHLYGTHCKHCGAKMVEPQESEDKE